MNQLGAILKIHGECSLATVTKHLMFPKGMEWKAKNIQVMREGSLLEDIAVEFAKNMKSMAVNQIKRLLSLYVEQILLLNHPQQNQRLITHLASLITTFIIGPKGKIAKFDQEGEEELDENADNTKKEEYAKETDKPMKNFHRALTSIKLDLAKRRVYLKDADLKFARSFMDKSLDELQCSYLPSYIKATLCCGSGYQSELSKNKYSNLPVF